MPLEGSIRDFGLSDIFQLIHVQQKSGLMTVHQQSRKATVGFLKGMVVSAQSSDRDGVERIGEVLVKAKRISPRQLEAALKTQRERGAYLGQVLVSEGVLSPDDLRRALRLQTLEAVYRLFRWKEGRYAFEQLPVSYPKEFLEPISTEHLLMEGVRRLDEWPYIEKKIPTLDMVFAQVPGKEGELDQPAPAKAAPAEGEDPLGDFEVEPEGRFSPDEITVYHALNGAYRVSEIIDLVQLGEFEVCKALANLMSAGLVVSLGVPASQEEVQETAGVVLGRLRVWLATGAQWTANGVLIAALSGAAVWSANRTWSRVSPEFEADVQAAQILMQPHYVRSLGELAGVWTADHGHPPTSIFEPLSTYGAAGLPLADAWGKPWTSTALIDTVSVNGTAGEDSPPPVEDPTAVEAPAAKDADGEALGPDVEGASAPPSQ